MEAGPLHMFLLEVHGFILVGGLFVCFFLFLRSDRNLSPFFFFFPKEGISLPPPHPHVLEIHIKRLQVNTCEGMAELNQDQRTLSGLDSTGSESVLWILSQCVKNSKEQAGLPSE